MSPIGTNLPENEFDITELKNLYQMRWGIETSFRELKYAIGLTHFHAKKTEYVKQEIWARLILYNFCEAKNISEGNISIGLAEGKVQISHLSVAKIYRARA